jgi:Tol biopolymer transport system component
MDLTSLASALSLSPGLPYALRYDPADSRHVVLAPRTLLDASTSYALTVTPDAHDVDGNPLVNGVAIEFSTGPLRPLRHWLTFGAGSGGLADGIWVADQRRLPREVAATPAAGFSWSQDGTHLLVQGGTGAWSDVTVGGGQELLAFKAQWAAFLAPDAGYVYLQPDGLLAQLAHDGRTVTIDQHVEEAAVAAGGRRLAYVVRGSAGESEIRGYDVDLRSHYRLQIENQTIDGLVWSPDGSRLAYRETTADPGRTVVRVRDLGPAGGVLTVGQGALSTPSWQADSRHLVLSATVTGPAGPTSRAFRLSAADAASRALVYDDSIPSPPDVEVRDPQPSPDGHQIAFLAPATGGVQVWLMNADGTGLAQVTSYDPASFPYSCDALTWTRS